MDLASISSAVAAAGAAADEPWIFSGLDPRELARTCEEELARRRAMLARMEQEAAPGGVLAQFNELSVRTGKFDDALAILQNAAPDKESRTAAQAALERLIPFGTEVFQSERLYARVAALQPADVQERSYRQWLIEQFEDTGATLPPQQRAQVKSIHEELASLALRFQARVNDVSTTVCVTPAQTDGLCEDWRRARKRDADGNYLVGMEYPSYSPFMEQAHDEDARRRVWTAFQNRAAPGNLELMDRAVALRARLAGIYGFADYASFSLRRKMAGTPQAVADFLRSVKAAVDEGEARELEELRREKASLSGAAPDAVRVERWDIAYLQQRVKKRCFQVDAEALRAYFPTEPAVRFVLHTAERLYGIRFVARDAPAWDEAVRCFEVFEDGEACAAASLGAIYLDLFPRAGKFSHAAVFGLRRGSTLAGQRPVKALLCNLHDKGLTPAELETLFHEFGHALHGVLSRARFADQSGTAVRQDFVEAPSMMFEEWARREVSLRGFAEACPQCPVLSTAQIGQLAAARNFGAGIRYARQWLFASFDLALHSGAPGQALEAWRRLEGASRLGHVEGTMMPASFSHLMGGYEAGYYSYMWAEVLALDMLTAFGANLLDAAVGRRYRQCILEPGGSRPPQELVEEFLGRKPDSRAFFAEITGQRY